jgi:hypothetical protein
MAQTLMTEAPDPPKLLAKERCDEECPAQALVRFKFPDGRILDFCGHHAEDYTIMLLAKQAVVIEDKRN